VSTKALYPTLYRVVTDLGSFSSMLLPDRALRAYQLAPAEAILESVERRASARRPVRDRLQPPGR